MSLLRQHSKLAVEVLSFKQYDGIAAVRPSLSAPLFPSALSRDASTSHEFTPDAFGNQLMN